MARATQGRHVWMYIRVHLHRARTCSVASATAAGQLALKAWQQQAAARAGVRMCAVQATSEGALLQACWPGGQAAACWHLPASLPSGACVADAIDKHSSRI